MSLRTPLSFRPERRLPESLRNKGSHLAAVARERTLDVYARHGARVAQLVGGDAPHESAVRYAEAVGVPDAWVGAVATRALARLALAPEAGPQESGPALRRDYQATRERLVMRLVAAEAEAEVAEVHAEFAHRFVMSRTRYREVDESLRDYADALGLSGDRQSAVEGRVLAELARTHLSTDEAAEVDPMLKVHQMSAPRAWRKALGVPRVSAATRLLRRTVQGRERPATVTRARTA